METWLLYILLSLYLFAPGSPTGSHSHYFYTTVTTKDNASDYPFYYTIRSIDDITLYRFDSGSGVAERRVPWFGGTNNGLLNATAEEHSLQYPLLYILESFRKRVNDTEGFHVLQLIEGCTMYDNRSSDGSYTYHYDGNPFLSLDMEKAYWTAEDPRAQYLADISNRNQTLTEHIRDILRHRCLSHITELLVIGNCTLSKKDRPIVVVTQTPVTNSPSTLHCRAYGHYPKNISMTWYKNEEPVSETLMERVTLPFPDLTYLTWASLNVTPKYDDVYTCSVGHISLIAPLKTEWRLPRETAGVNHGIANGGIIAICLGVILLLVLIVFVFVALAKSRR